MNSSILSLSAIGAITLSAITLAVRKKVFQYLPLLSLFFVVYFLDNLIIVLVNLITPPGWTFLQAKIGWGALITSLLFGLLHGFWVDVDLTVHLNLIVVLFNGLAGFLYAWQRERTGSLLIPS